VKKISEISYSVPLKLENEKVEIIEAFQHLFSPEFMRWDGKLPITYVEHG
jgi:hypothetical protein